MNKYILGTNENREFLKELREDLLSFGRDFPSPEGSSYYLGDDGRPWKDRPRQTWITSRMAHVYSIGEILGYKGCGKLADEALRGLNGELFDSANGGWYAGRYADGGIMPDKECYAHAFVILAASSARLARRDGADELLQKALEVYDRYFWDEEEGLSRDTWNTDFTVLSDYRGLNANMHTVEAFLAASDALSDDIYKKRAGRIIERVTEWAGSNGWRIPEHFTRDWEPDREYSRDNPKDCFKPYGATPGHGIEWARLIVQWAVSEYGEGSEKARKYTDMAQKLYDRAISDAWSADGAPGLCYTTDWNGAPIVHDRMHWTLAEAINSSAVLYRVTNDKRYADDYEQFIKYLDEKVIDRENGSWFHQLDKNNRVTDTVWPGKSDLYHAFQATLIPYNEKTGVSIAAAVI